MPQPQGLQAPITLTTPPESKHPGPASTGSLLSNLRSKWKAIFAGQGMRRVGKGVAWALAGQVIGRGSGLVAGLLAANLLGVDGFGQLGIIRSSIGAFAVFAGLGLGITATRFVAANRDTNPAFAGQVIGLCNLAAIVMSCLMALALFFYAPQLASGALQDASLTGALRIGAAMLLATSLLGAANGTLAGFEDFRSIALSGAVEGVTVLALTFPLAHWYGVDGAVGALVISRFAGLLTVQIRVLACCRKYAVKTSYRDISGHARILWQYSLPAFLTGALYGPAIWILNLIVVAQPKGYSMLGLMSAADQWKMLILFVPAALGNVLLPMLANIDDDRKQQRAVKLNIQVQTAIALCVALPIAGLSPFLAGLYDASFDGIAPMIALACAIAIFHTLGGAAGNAIMSTGSAWHGCAFNFSWAVLLICIGLRLVPQYGAIGLALSYLLAQAAHGISCAAFVLSFEKQKRSDVPT